eukprot:3957661-Prymnesium_polylepis.1
MQGLATPFPAEPAAAPGIKRERCTPAKTVCKERGLSQPLPPVAAASLRVCARLNTPPHCSKYCPSPDPHIPTIGSTHALT